MGPRSSGAGFFCSHALGDTKQKKPTALDRGPPLHVNRVLESEVNTVLLIQGDCLYFARLDRVGACLSCHQDRSLCARF